MAYRLSLVFLALLATSVYAQKPRNHREEALLLAKILREQHVAPKALNDNFSRQVFAQFTSQLDPDKLYFSAADLQTLAPHETRLDDELGGTTWDFLPQVTALYRQALERAERTIAQTGATAFTGTVKEYISFDTVRWPADAAALQAKWRLWLKHQTLQRMVDVRVRYEGPEKEFFTRQEPEARKRVTAYELRTVRRILQHPGAFENYVAAQYFQSIAAVFDPHTTYMPVTEMENFLSTLSTEGYYFGITLDENERGDVLITALAPGGPAWKSGDIHAADVLTGLRWDGEEETDVEGFTLEEANAILADANHRYMEFTVRRQGGVVKKVKLQKEKISLEENYVRSYVLDGKHRIGYIALPDFYTRWDDESEGSRCAGDVANEVMKLRQENIHGLILDIRFNGGGSLMEAVAMAGIFLDEGPLGMLRNRQQDIITLKDLDRGTVYDGPLVLLVNGQSASASEFLAAVLQDYRRAVIAGSRTFGKATAQNFFPLDPTQAQGPSLETIKDGPGFASITTDKIYRVTGGTAQGGGVRPDILLPEVFDIPGVRESAMPFALPADSILKRNYFRALPPLPLDSLRARSVGRVTTSATFQHIANGRRRLADEFHTRDEPVSLLWDALYTREVAMQQQYRALEKSLEQISRVFTVSNGSVDRQRLAADDYAKDFNKSWITNLQKDVYVEEAVNILTDMIDLSAHAVK
jgi:carboxyl-terminal processing protease